MSWPKLSEQLTGPIHPERCQGCGAGIVATPLSRWREHDEADRPTAVVVMLCKRCEYELIEKHPRLYDRLAANEPLPGTMDLCVHCRHRDGVACKHNDLKANGGPGLMLTIARPVRAHISRVPRRLSGFVTLWPRSADGCAGREEAAIDGP